MAVISIRTIVICVVLYEVGLILGYLTLTTVLTHLLHKSLQIGISDWISGEESDLQASYFKNRIGLSHIQTNVSCGKLIAGNQTEQAWAQKLMDARSIPGDFRSDEGYAEDKCPDIKLRYVTQTLSQEEADFPIAFALTVFKDFYQVEKLFRAVYRPEHFYCFHVDKQSNSSFYQAMLKYTTCFTNVVMAEKRVEVRWSKFSVLEADLLCMEKLLGMSKKWRYFINLTGQEYPLRTMRELVRILKALNGANNLENAGTHTGTPPLLVKLADGSKRAIKWYKGSLHVTVTRGFAEYAFSDIGKQISEHLRKHGGWPCPDETFFATLNHNADVLNVPGADLTYLKTDNVKHPFFNRYKNWFSGAFNYPCLSGKGVRQICIWGIRDLPAMNKRFELFVNKFYYNFQRFALQCMAERFWNNTLADYKIDGVRKTHKIPLTFYSSFEFIKKHLN